MLMTPALWRYLLLLVLLITGSEWATAQSRKPPDERWDVANSEVVAEAEAVYSMAREGLLNLDYPSMVKTFADNAAPLVLPKDRTTDADVAKYASLLASHSEHILKTRQIQIDVDLRKPSRGQAMMTEIVKNNHDLLVVRIPLRNTSTIAQSHSIHSNGWTVDGNGDLSILMVKHDGVWYWNPFGW